jgi:hypothetical protein
VKRFARLALVLSLAINIGFGLAWLGHRRAPVSPAPYPRHDAHRRMPGGEEFTARTHGAWASRRAQWLDRHLHLDPQRREELQSSLLPLEPQMIDTRQRLEEARRDFAQELREPVPNRDSVLVAHEKISQLQTRLDSLVTEALLKEAKFLRPEDRRRPGAWFPRRRGMNEGERR